MTVSLRSKNKTKVKIIKLAFTLVMIVFMARLVWLQVIDREKFLAAAERQQNHVIEIQAERGRIYDRNMQVLAEDIDSYTYYLVPERIGNKRDVARKLARITGQSGWLTKFKQHPKFLYIERKTTKKMERRLESSGIKELAKFVEPRRVYPSGQLGLAVLGRVDIDNKGLSGLEIQYDTYLSGKNGKAILKRDGLGYCYDFNQQPVIAPQSGSDIVTTIDLNLQQIVEQEMVYALKENDAVFGIGLFMKAGTGEILACAVLDSLGVPATRNRAITDQYEPGSTFKLITIAQALVSGLYKLDDRIYVEDGKFRINRRTIRDDHEYDTLTVGDALVFSSNIAHSKMALALGDQAIFKAIKEAGFIEKLGVDFPAEAAGYITSPSWRDHYLANISFGHGVSASPLQIISLYNAVASNGYLHKPYFASEMIKPDGSHSVIGRSFKIRKLYNDNIRYKLKGLLREVVERGTATKAVSEQVNISGKTGTALKLNDDGRGYNHKKARASFVGYFPSENPMVVGIIIFDSPKTSRYGGETAVPVFRNIAERYYCLPQMMAERYVEGNVIESEPNAEYASVEYIEEYEEVIEKIKPYYDLNHMPDKVPDFKGLTVRQAIKLASLVGVEFRIEGSGIVKSQSPQAGAAIADMKMLNLRCKNK